MYDYLRLSKHQNIGFVKTGALQTVYDRFPHFYHPDEPNRPPFAWNEDGRVKEWSWDWKIGGQSAIFEHTHIISI